MTTAGSSLNSLYTRDDMRSIAMGIGAGLQAYDRDKPLASIGAAISGAAGTTINREANADALALSQKQRELERSDRDELRAEQRSQTLDDRAEQRSNLLADRDWGAQQDVLRGDVAHKQREAVKDSDAARAKKLQADAIQATIDSGFHSALSGSNTSHATPETQRFQSMQRDFFQMYGGSTPVTDGNAPASWFNPNQINSNEQITEYPF